MQETGNQPGISAWAETEGLKAQTLKPKLLWGRHSLLSSEKKDEVIHKARHHGPGPNFTTIFTVVVKHIQLAPLTEASWKDHKSGCKVAFKQDRQQFNGWMDMTDMA